MEKVKGFVVVLKEDMDWVEAEPILNAISLINGVDKVSVSQLSSDDVINREKVKSELVDILLSQITDHTTS